MSSPLWRQISPSREPSFCSSAPAVAAGRLHFVVPFPAELDGIAFAGAVDGASEAIEGELAAAFIK
jgi:hypothetical protein